MMRHTALTACVVAETACVAPLQVPHKPAPVPVAAPAATAAPAIGGDWRDVPLTSGTWRYGPGKDGSIASFGVDGRPAVFTVRCEIAGRTIAFQRPGAGATGTAKLTTSSGVRQLPTGAILDGMGWRLAGRDPLLDQIAFSRGRFVVEGLGPRLVLPAWAEVARVIEDCRG